MRKRGSELARNRISERRPEVAARKRIVRVFRVFRGYSLPRLAAISAKTAWIVCAFVVVACLALAGCESSPGPADYAQATAISQAAALKATATAQAIQIEATAAAQEAAERQATAGARSLAIGLLWLALGLCALVLAVSVAFSIGAALTRRATTIYPNRAGLYPLITRRELDGSLIVHDPNRAVGASTVYHAPSVTAAVAGRVGLSWPAVTASGQDASEAAQVQVAGQAQAISLMAAATRPAGWLERPQPQHNAAREQAQNAAASAGLTGDRMPAMRQVTDPDKNARFVELINS